MRDAGGGAGRELDSRSDAGERDLGDYLGEFSPRRLSSRRCVLTTIVRSGDYSAPDDRTTIVQVINTLGYYSANSTLGR